MERERLTRLLEDPARITRQDLADLVAMAERYPWFSGAQLLRAAGERLGGDVLSDETLRTAGAHLPSRAALFDLTSTNASKPKPPLRIVRAEEATLVETVLTAPEYRTTPEPLPEATAQAPVEPIHPVAPPEPEPEVRIGAVPAEPVTVDELELQILENAAVGAYDLTILEQLPGTPLPALAGAIGPDRSAPIEHVPHPVLVERTARLRFSEWLEAVESPTLILETPRHPAPKPSPQERLDTSSLIDRFIRHETPEPKKNAFFTPQQAGKRSLDDSAGLVTETLARIYARQGNTAKAIEAYRRLALKYPDKSSYFAALSKELENQQNT